MDNRVQIGIVAAIIAVIMGVGVVNLGSYPPLEKSLGATLIDRRGRDVEVSELESKDYVFIYFSAGWCPPCRKFTPELVEFYEKEADDRNFEVIFVSADQSDSDMTTYMQRYGMPWLAVPYSDYGVRQKLRDIYGGRGGIPNLVLMDSDGKVLSSSYQRGEYVGPGKVLADFDSY